ncbi:unnamed protein product [Trichogramma brassicae]|uniref:Uncharacterized protein n=1 Tax=Trichogramma brassicae TaxID=86971 RepID=A0A6H5IN28_9HYME|nr:unnamed protein product [Trichogramma brassicae]
MWCNVDCHDNVSRALSKAKQSYARIICTRGVGEALRSSPPPLPGTTDRHSRGLEIYNFLSSANTCVPRSTAALQSPFPRPPSAAARYNVSRARMIKRKKKDKSFGRFTDKGTRHLVAKIESSIIQSFLPTTRMLNAHGDEDNRQNNECAPNEFALSFIRVRRRCGKTNLATHSFQQQQQCCATSTVPPPPRFSPEKACAARVHICSIDVYFDDCGSLGARPFGAAAGAHKQRVSPSQASTSGGGGVGTRAALILQQQQEERRRRKRVAKGKPSEKEKRERKTRREAAATCIYLCIISAWTSSSSSSNRNVAVLCYMKPSNRNFLKKGHLDRNLPFLNRLTRPASETREVSEGHAYARITACALPGRCSRGSPPRNGALGRRRQPYIVRPLENIGYWPIYGRGSPSAGHRLYPVSLFFTILTLSPVLLVVSRRIKKGNFRLFVYNKMKTNCFGAAQRSSPEIDSSKQHTTERARNSKQNEKKKGTNVSIRWPLVCTTKREIKKNRLHYYNCSAITSSTYNYNYCYYQLLILIGTILAAARTPLAARTPYIEYIQDRLALVLTRLHLHNVCAPRTVYNDRLSCLIRLSRINRIQTTAHDTFLRELRGITRKYHTLLEVPKSRFVQRATTTGGGEEAEIALAFHPAAAASELGSSSSTNGADHHREVESSLRRLRHRSQFLSIAAAAAAAAAAKSVTRGEDNSRPSIRRKVSFRVLSRRLIVVSLVAEPRLAHYLRAASAASAYRLSYL